jgi:hypothetical protein
VGVVVTIFTVSLTMGVDTFFKTLAKLASSSELLLAKSGNNWLYI